MWLHRKAKKLIIITARSRRSRPAQVRTSTTTQLPNYLRDIQSSQPASTLHVTCGCSLSNSVGLCHGCRAITTEYLCI